MICLRKVWLSLREIIDYDMRQAVWCLQAVQQAQAAAEGWADNIVASRASAIDTAKAASEHAQVNYPVKAKWSFL